MRLSIKEFYRKIIYEFSQIHKYRENFLFKNNPLYSSYISQPKNHIEEISNILS